MFSMGDQAKTRGAGHLVLNVVRAFNVIGLLAASIASMSMLAMSLIKGFFSIFDFMSHIFTTVICIFLILTEIGFPTRRGREWLAHTWPAFSAEHSLAWLGFAMVVIGCGVLSDLDKKAFSQDNLSMPLWRLTYAAGLMAIIFGIFNFFASVIFRSGKQGLNCRMIRADGNLATAPDPKNFYDDLSRTGSSHSRAEVETKQSGVRRMTKLFAPKRGKAPLTISNPILHPRQEQPEPEADVEMGHSSVGDEWDNKSLEDRGSPIAPNIQRPPTAAHPAYQGARYSLASNITRF